MTTINKILMDFLSESKVEEAKCLLNMISEKGAVIESSSSVDATESTIYAPKKDDYVIVRCRDAGVHSGRYQNHKGREVNLTSSRRLWYWKCKEGHSLSGLAVAGLHQDSKCAAEVSVTLLEACEIIKVNDNSVESFINQPVHNKDD